MKRFVLLLSLAVLAAAFASAQIAKGKDAWVSSKTAALKSSTGFFASKRGDLAYGDQVSVLQIKGSWAEVQSVSKKISGWVSTASLTAKRVVATGGANASASEIALAGKGFNEEVENAYKAEGNLNYADVDATEKITVPEQDLFNFMKDGLLIIKDE